MTYPRTVYKLDTVLWESGAHFYQADAREREWIEEKWGQAHSLPVELFDRETRTANMSWEANVNVCQRKTQAAFKGVAQETKGFEESAWNFTD